MKYLDNIIDALMEVHLFEMAYQRKHMVSKTRDLSMHIAKHITKIALYPQHDARHHWVSEANAALDDIDNYAYDGKKKLKEDEYHSILFKEPFENTGLVDNVARKEISLGMFNHKWTDEHKEHLYGKINDVYKTISKQLASKKFVHLDNVLSEHSV
jgi:hypothetical protein